jgi:ornithine cyclodeaminase/alanine dehydrogenase-like protein (mu-crystallin family)
LEQRLIGIMSGSVLIIGRVQGRVHARDITLFKSVGTAVEDLALANLVVEVIANLNAADP